MKIQRRPPIDRPHNEGAFVIKKLLEISNWATSKRLEALTVV